MEPTGLQAAVSRRAALRLGAAAVLGGVSACSSGKSTDGRRSGSDKEFTLWSMWVKGQAGQRLVQGAIEDFTEETGIRVNVQWKGVGVVQAITPAVTAGTPPADMIEESAQVPQTFGPGLMVDLTDLYSTKIPGDTKTVGEAVGSYVSQSKYLSDAEELSSAPYSMGYWTSSDAMFYNGARFPELKGNPPKTWDDFIGILEAQRAKGRRPLALDGSIPGYSYYYFSYMVWSLLGPDGLLRAYQDKTGRTWQDPAYLQAAKLVEQLVQARYFIDGYDASKFPAMENKWANNDADFLLMGTWIKEEVLPVAAPGFDFQAFTVPAMAGGSAPPAAVYVDGFSIFKKSKNQEAAKQFLAFFMQKKYQQQVASILKSIPVRSDVAAPDFLQPVKQALDSGRGNEVRLPPKLAPMPTTAVWPVDDKLIFGKISAEEFISQLVQQTQQWWRSRG